MSNSTLAARRRGFTLIELLIVIVVIAILALIVIPRVMGASRKAQESSLKGNLQELRNAIEQFQADTGCYPTNLADLVATTQPATAYNPVDGQTEAMPAGTYKGPYLTPQGGLDGSGIPINPFYPNTSDGNTLASLATDLPHNWTYTQGNVSVATPASGNTLDGIPYTNL